MLMSCDGCLWRLSSGVVALPSTTPIRVGTGLRHSERQDVGLAIRQREAARNFTVYGSVTSNQDISAGNYGDTVVATVNL